MKILDIMETKKSGSDVWKVKENSKEMIEQWLRKERGKKNEKNEKIKRKTKHLEKRVERVLIFDFTCSAW